VTRTGRGLQTLVGDSVDNVPGVTGVGVKTAAKLLQEHKTLDNLLGSLDKVKGKLKENLQAAVPKLPLSRSWCARYVRSDRDGLGRMAVEGLGWPQTAAALRGVGLRSMAREVRESLPLSNAAPAAGRAGRQGRGPCSATSSTDRKCSLRSQCERRGGDPDMPRARAKVEATYELVATPKKFEVSSRS
jgi:hypothetical protein